MIDALINDIHLGDCIDIMRQIPNACVDVVITDPPYGMAYQSGHRKERRNR